MKRPRWIVGSSLMVAMMALATGVVTAATHHSAAHGAHLDAVLFLNGIQPGRSRGTLQLSGVFSSTNAGRRKSFSSFIELDGLSPGTYTLHEDFYGSNGKLLQSFNDPVTANKLPPYNNYIIRNWNFIPTVGRNTLMVYLGQRLLGYGVFYGKKAESDVSLHPVPTFINI